MYPRVKRVRRGDQVHAYVQLVEGHRVEGRVRQRVVATLGRLDELKASGQLDRWAGAFTRLDPPALGTRRELGPLLLVAHYLRRLGLVELIDRTVPMRGRSLLTHGEVVAALVANRLTSPAPLYDVAGWASAAAVVELLGVPGGLLNDDRLGRALDAFHPVTEEVRGKLLLRTLERFDVKAGRLHLDLTQLRFAGAYPGSTVVQKGWGADRQVARQVEVLQATTTSGVSLYVRPYPGAMAEVTALATALENLQKLLPPGLVVVIDSAFGRLSTLAAAQRQGLGFVVPLRADTGWIQAFNAEVGSLEKLEEIDHVAERQRRLPAALRTRYRGCLRPFRYRDPQTRSQVELKVAYIWSSEEARSVGDARERGMVKAEQELARVRNGLGGRYYKTVKQVQDKVARIVGAPIEPLLRVTVGAETAGRPTLSWHRDTAAIEAAGRLDGLYALATNLPDPLTAAAVLDIHKDQWVVEQRHRDAKRPRPLRVRPVFLHTDARIDALIGIVGIALLVFGLIEADLRRRLPAQHPQLPGLLPEGRAAKPTGRNILAAFEGLALTYTRSGLVLDHLTPTQRQVLALLDIPLPWVEQQDPSAR